MRDHTVDRGAEDSRNPSRWLGIAAGIGILALAACVQHPVAPAPAPPAPPAEAVQPQEEPPPPPPHKPPKPKIVAIPNPVPLPQTPTPEINSPDQLIGFDQSRTEALLGEPQERAEEAPATIWRYVGQDCELRIFFYLDLQSQVMRALHYEVKSNDTTDPAHNRCFDQLVAERRTDAVHAVGADPPH